MTAMESSGGSLPLVNLALCLDLDLLLRLSVPCILMWFRLLKSHGTSIMTLSLVVKSNVAVMPWMESRERDTAERDVIDRACFSNDISRCSTRLVPPPGWSAPGQDGWFPLGVKDGGRVSSFSGSSPDGWTHLGGARTGQEPWRISGE